MVWHLGAEEVVADSVQGAVREAGQHLLPVWYRQGRGCVRYCVQDYILAVSTPASTLNAPAVRAESTP